ncbi:hypothetical protein EJB05_39887 [Eragrostis curvula]|uniref:Uncharacterized protein n=1 Tax=Eragrostis curvula TaxID=38414 RepID=A0A5J9TY77_9POAL|nr:hypothetical protein EJB05_39887 [Eragrostis curvula]
MAQVADADADGTRSYMDNAFSINIRLPGYKAILDDGTRTDLEAADHVLDVNMAREYLMHDLVDGLATKTIWGTDVQRNVEDLSTVRMEIVR